MRAAVMRRREIVIWRDPTWGLGVAVGVAFMGLFAAAWMLG
jgi:hypothetical protein